MQNALPLLLIIFFTSGNSIVADMTGSKFNFFKQAINVPAIRQLGNVLQNPHLLLPQISLSSVAHLDMKKLRDKYGIKAVIFDKDNTLSLCYVDELHPSCRSAIVSSKEVFGAHAVAILSNSVGSNDDSSYLGAEKTEASMGITVIRHVHKKPGCLQEVLAHFAVTGSASLEPRQICMVGDRVLTDVLFANMNGMLSVLVAPICIRTDHPLAAVIRGIERRLILPLIRLLGVRPGIIASRDQN